MSERRYNDRLQLQRLYKKHRVWIQTRQRINEGKSDELFVSKMKLNLGCRRD